MCMAGANCRGDRMIEIVDQMCIRLLLLMCSLCMAGANCEGDRMFEDVSAGDLVCGIYTPLVINVFSMCCRRKLRRPRLRYIYV